MKYFFSTLTVLLFVAAFGVQCSSHDDAAQPTQPTQPEVVSPPPACLVKSIKTFSFVSGDSIAFSYDSYGRISEIVVTLLNSSVSPGKYTVSYYKDRLPSEITSGKDKFTFEYDASDRLTTRKYYAGGKLNSHDDLTYDDAGKIKQMLRYLGDEISDKYYYDYAGAKNPVYVIDSGRDVSNKFVFYNRIRFTVDGSDRAFAGISADFLTNTISLTAYGFTQNVIGIGYRDKNDVVGDYINMFGPNTYNDKNFPLVLSGTISSGGNKGSITRTFTYICK